MAAHQNYLKRTEIDWDNVKILYEQGAPLRAIARICKVPQTTLRWHVVKYGWKMPPAFSDRDKAKSVAQLIAETDLFLAIAARNIAAHLATLQGKNALRYAAQVRIINDTRAQLLGQNGSQVGSRKNGKRSPSGNYFAADVDELAQLTETEQTTDSGSTTDSRDSTND
jgi:hypothetical protein